MIQEQEAQQAKTMAELKAQFKCSKGPYNNTFAQSKAIALKDNLIYRLFEIVDSQAQKIAEARRCAERMKASLEQAGAEGLIDNDADLSLPWETTDSKEVAR